MLNKTDEIIIEKEVVLLEAARKPKDIHIQKALELEAQGPLVWLKTLFPFAFDDEFSEEHKKYWELRWSVFMRIREQKKYVALGLPIPEKFIIHENEWNVLKILGRGLGKSSTLEAGAVQKGALLDGGYCLYVSESQDQSEEHISNCRILIDHPDSRLSEFYPGMRLADGKNKYATSGEKLKDGQEIFITENGWICRGKGLNAKLRGLRIGNKRPDHIVLDDVDGVNDSIGVSKKKIGQIGSSIIPTQARRFATLDFGQNLIGENSVMNQTHNGKAGILAARTVIGIANAFERFEEGLDYEKWLDDEGNIRYRILPTAKPTWKGLDIPNAQKFLNDTGIDIFLAEYQNVFEHLKTEKVYHEYDEARHIITWSDFEKLFGVRYVPQHWRCGGATDIGYTASSLSAWSFVATSAKNSPLPGHYFLYRGLTFENEAIETQAETLWEDFFPDPEIGRRHFEANQNFFKYPELLRLLKTKPRCAPWLENYTVKKEHLTRPKTEFDKVEDKNLLYVNEAAKSWTSQIKFLRISHEKTGEQKTLAKMYGIPIHKTKEFRADSGVTETNHLLRGDYTQPHPFYSDEKILDEKGLWTGLYKLGRPFLYFVVADDQKKTPRDDAGLKRHREQISNQRWTEEVISENDKLIARVPGKANSDCGDSLRMWAVEYQTPKAEDLTKAEKVREALPDKIKPLADKRAAKKPLTMGEQLALDDEMRATVKKVEKQMNPEFNTIQDGISDYKDDLGFNV